MRDEPEDIRQAVKIYKALGEPTRFRIARMLANDPPLCCADLGTRLESVAGSTLSHHLKQLTDCGLLEASKDGTFVYHKLNREVAKRFAPVLFE